MGREGQEHATAMTHLLRWFAATLLVSSSPAWAADDLCGGTVGDREGSVVVHVSEAASTCPWGFTVPTLVLSCVTRQGYPDLAALVATTNDDRVFALNGTARQWLDLPPPDAIWKNRPDIPDAKVDITPWMDVAREACRF